MNQNFDFPETRPSRIKIIIIIVAAILLYGLFAGIRANTSLLTAELSAFTGLSYGEVSSAFSILNLVFAISIPFVGILTLKIQKFYIMLVGAIFCAIGFIGTAFSMETWQLIVFIGIFFGVGSSFLSFTIVYSAARAFVSGKASSILAGILLASQGVLGMVASHAIDGFIDGFGLTLCLIIISVSALCLVPFTFLFLRRKNSPKENEEKVEEAPVSLFKVLKRIVTHPFFYILALGAFTFGLGDGGLMNHLSQYVGDIFETDIYSPSLVSVYSISIMSGALIGGFVASKVKNKMVAFGNVVIAWSLFNCVILLFVNHEGFGLNVALVSVILTFMNGFLINFACPFLIGVAVDHVSVAVSAAVLAIIECGSFVAYSLDSFLGGLIHDVFGNFLLIDTIASCLAIITGIVFICYSAKTKKRKKVPII